MLSWRSIFLSVVCGILLIVTDAQAQPGPEEVVSFVFLLHTKSGKVIPNGDTSCRVQTWGLEPRTNFSIGQTLFDSSYYLVTVYTKIDSIVISWKEENMVLLFDAFDFPAYCKEKDALFFLADRLAFCPGTYRIRKEDFELYITKAGTKCLLLKKKLRKE